MVAAWSMACTCSALSSASMFSDAAQIAGARIGMYPAFEAAFHQQWYIPTVVEVRMGENDCVNV